jgi:hypothetical protein
MPSSITARQASTVVRTSSTATPASRIATPLNSARVCSSKTHDPVLHSPYEEIARPMCPRERGGNCGVGQDVGIEADYHRSCNSSRGKALTAAPQGSPCVMTSIA